MFESNVQSHAWLRIKNWEVDITADQFNDQTRKIIIEKKSKWHRTFKSYDVCQYPEGMSFNEVFENDFHIFYRKAFLSNNNLRENRLLFSHRKKVTSNK